MSHIESGNSFQGEITYSNPNLRPGPIVRGTSNVFDLYFKYGVADFSLGTHFLVSHTLTLIDCMRMGLARNPDRVDRFLKASAEDINRALQFDRAPNVTPDESLEALDFALITMGKMPDAVQRYKDKEGNEHSIDFSRRGIFRPPFTLDQTRERLKELWVETNKIAQGITDPAGSILADPRKARAVTFFEIGSNILMVNPDEQRIDAKKNFPDILAAKYNTEEF